MAEIISTNRGFFPELKEETVILIKDNVIFNLHDPANPIIGNMIIGFSFDTHLKKDEFTKKFDCGGIVSLQQLRSNPDGIFMLQNVFRRAFLLDKLTIVPRREITASPSGIEFYAGQFEFNVRDIAYDNENDLCIGDFGFLSKENFTKGGVLNDVFVQVESTSATVTDKCMILKGEDILKLYDVLHKANLFERKL